MRNSVLPWIMDCTRLYFFSENCVKSAHTLIDISHTLSRRLDQIITGRAFLKAKKQLILVNGNKFLGEQNRRYFHSQIKLTKKYYQGSLFVVLKGFNNDELPYP